MAENYRDLPDEELTREEQLAKIADGKIVNLRGRTAANEEELDFALNAKDVSQEEPLGGAIPTYMIPAQEFAGRMAESQAAQRIAALEAQVEDLTHSRDEAETKLGEALDANEGLGKQNDDLTETVDALKKANQALTARIAELEAIATAASGGPGSDAPSADAPVDAKASKGK